MNPGSYLTLPERFFSRVAPTPVAAPRLIKINESLAADLQFDLRGLDADALAQFFSGNRLLPGSAPLAMAYAGHQFGHFVAQLGDGRAILLGEMTDRRGSRFDIQLKGCGRTPYSRGGDGRAALGPVLREYLVSEAMHALGIPATRSLAAVTTGETVLRERALPGAIVTRVAASHVRVGTFEYFAARQDVAAVRLLADYVIERHYPQLGGEALRYLRLLQAVIARQANLVAGWMHVGFIHGVMNTDNMAVSGETIDFGPCAFMDAFDPAAVFSSIDARGRYAYDNQPHAAAWNLARLAETLLPLIADNPADAVATAKLELDSFAAQFAEQWLQGMRRKLGLLRSETGDWELAQDLLRIMHAHAADFTLTFRALCEAAEARDRQIEVLFAGAAGFNDWLQRWRARLAAERAEPDERARRMRRSNPQFIPRNHRIEQLITAAVERGDFSMFEEFARVLERPFETQSQFAHYAAPPLQNERVLQTFCGT